MQGLVTLDFGNSNPHAGIFHKIQNQWQLIKVAPWNELSLYLSQLEMNASNTQLVLSEVKEREEELFPLLQQGYLLTRLKDYWRGTRFAGMPVNYANTLGEDRLITAFYSYKKDKTPTLIIDAGTFVTMDVVTEKGFQGGYIIPGIKTYFASFTQGEQLKNVELHQNLQGNLPQNTADAMSESYFGFAALAQKLVLQHQIKRILLTGGQNSLWEGLFKELPEGVVLQTEPNLIHLALQYWMTTQIETL